MLWCKLHHRPYDCQIGAAGIGAAALLSLPFDAAAAEPGAELETAEKSQYNLFHPTPTSLLREMSADRPDKTESPYTVDAGHFQIETDFVIWNEARDDEHSATARTWVFGGPLNFKAGLWNDLDVEFVLPAWQVSRVSDHGTSTTSRGVTDFQLRAKWNIWGNDGGRTALALLPLVVTPTGTGGAQAGGWEGGLKIPLAIEVPDWEVGAMTEFDCMRNESGGGYHAEFNNTISVGRTIWGPLGAYVEFAAVVSTESGSSWAGTVDTWLTYQVNENLRFDLGVNIGVTRAADDWQPFVGVTWRF